MVITIKQHIICKYFNKRMHLKMSKWYKKWHNLKMIANSILLKLTYNNMHQNNNVQWHIMYGIIAEKNKYLVSISITIIMILNWITLKNSIFRTQNDHN